MNSFRYDLPVIEAKSPVFMRLMEAEDLVARLDERIRTSPVAEGVRRRMLYREACACRLAEGQLVHVDELVLVETGALGRITTEELSAAWDVLKVLELAAEASPQGLLNLPRPGLPVVEERTVETRKVPDMFYVPNWGEQERMAAWRKALADSRDHPPLLAAFVAWDAWLVLEPEQRGAWRAPLIASLVLAQRGKTRSFRLPVDVGRQFAVYRRTPHQDWQDRLCGFLQWVMTATEQYTKEISRLTLARDGLQMNLKGKRRNSRLASLVELLIALPVISAPMAARSLRCSAAAIHKMLPQLGSRVREVTGRERFRLYGL